MDEDARLVRRFLQGDSFAFETLYRRYYERVYSIARGILLDADEATDAAQEIFTLVFRNLDRFDHRSKFSTWLFRVAVNRSIQEGRRNRNRRRGVELSESLPIETEETPESDPRVQEALERLQPSDRAILVLFYWEELSLIEIGRSLGCGPNAAKTRLYRARERFRSAFDGEFA